MDNDRRGKSNPTSDPTGATSILERRRIAKVVHDDRGNASVEWVTGPTESGERVELSLEENEPTYRRETGYDPYQKAAKARAEAPKGRVGAAAVTPVERPAKRDLRKLSEWIKQMRELEARKQSGEDTDEK